MESPQDIQAASSSTAFTVTVSEIYVVDLPKVKPFNRSASPYAVLTLEGQQRLETPTVHKSQTARWNVDFQFFANSPSARLNVNIYHRPSTVGGPKFLCSFTGLVRDLTDASTAHELTKDGEAAGRIALKVLVEPQSPAMVASPLSLQRSLSAGAVERPVTPQRGSVPMGRYSTLDSSSSRVSAASYAAAGAAGGLSLVAAGAMIQGGYQIAQGLAPYITPLSQALGSLEKLVDIVESIAQVHPICLAAFLVLGAVYKIMRDQTRQDQNMMELAIGMRDMLAFSNETTDLGQIKGGIDVIKEMGIAVKDTCELIQEYMQTPFFRRAMKGAVSNDVSNRIAFCKRRFAYLNEQFDRTLAVRTWTAVGKQAEASARKDNVDLLTNLPNVHDLKAGYDWVDPCLPGTRTILLAEIESWLESYEHDDPRIMWLFGMAGMGKSTLAATAARLLEQSQRLGGTFFFSRAVAERSNPHYIFSTIASQLVTRVPKVAEGIFTALREDPGLGKSALSTQFHKLIVGPLIAAHDLSVPIVLVFDALDECTMPPAVLSIIGAEIMKLPPLFKILITSRPEQAILDLMDSMGSSVVRHGLQRDLDVDRDIEKFILKRMSDVARRFHLQSDWPGKENRKALVEKAGGLFIWISTALKFIEDEDEDDPEGQLKLILNEGGGSQMSSSPMSDLDTLYLQVLNQAFSFKASERRIGLFRKIVGAIITIKNPLTAIALGTLLDLGSTAEAAGSTVKQNIRKLQALLVVPGNKPIHTIHPSFADFLSDPSRCTDEHFYIDRKPQHYFLACQSLRLMAQMLRPNLCSVDPGLFNSEIGDLQDRISRNIPDALQYACRFWGEHLSAAEHEDELYGLVRDFYFTNLLSWIEVLSLLNDIGYAFQCLESAEHWLMAYDQTDTDTLTLATDSQRFLKEFREPIQLSARHVYYSALPFSPKSSLIYRTYTDQFKSHSIDVLMGVSEKWSTCLSVLERHDSFVTAVAFSPDGQRIVSGAGDHTLRLWDGISGAPIGPALDGHTDPITQVAFSPDGKRVISAAEDNNLRLWDAITGAPIGLPLEGHTSDVSTFAISPDGTVIVSGSYDSTLRMWDGAIGSPLLRPLVGHTAGVTAVAFSPDGKRIVSGSYDNTLRLWDASRGTPIGQPLQGHPEYITAIAYSPDGARIVSGSYDSAAKWDNILRMWDGLTGEPVGDPMIGHSSNITSIAYSPDGQRVVTGSADNNLRLWDSITGAPIGEPLQGHTGPVNTVAYTPKGKRIVSGSRDTTLRLWDGVTGEPIGEPLEGHTDYVTSVAFSPDGRRVISTSDDHTLRLWEGRSGPALEEVLHGHDAAVTSVAFSPDGRRIVTGSWDDCLQVWDGVTGARIGEPLRGHMSAVTAVAFSADGRRLVSGSRDDTVRLWDAITGAPIGDALLGHTSTVTTVGFSRDGQRIVSGSWDCDLRLWNASTRAPIGSALKGHTAAVTSAAFSPDGSLIVSGGGDGALRLWDGMNGKSAGEPLQGHASVVISVAFSPDGSQIISKDESDVVFWDVFSRSPVVQSPGSEAAPVYAHTLSLNYATGWFSGGPIGRKKLWWMPKVNRGTYAFTKDGHTLVTGSELGRVTLVDGRRLAPLLRRAFTLP